jgi:hypothetical protein
MSRVATSLATPLVAVLATLLVAAALSGATWSVAAAGTEDAAATHSPQSPSDWEADVRARHPFPPAHDNRALVAPGTQGDGHRSRRTTERDVLLWQRETERFVAEGARVFHSAAELGGTAGVSCATCHPDAAGTHAETYPKYQIQIGRVALLRDMANWCLENGVRAPRMAEDDARLRALEAYLLAQRSGRPLTYGQH